MSCMCVCVNTIEIKAIDKCAREGKVMQLYLPGKEIPPTPTPILQFYR